MKTALSMTLLAAALLCRASDLGQLQQLYEGILHSENDASLPKRESLDTQDMEDRLKALTAEDARALLPIGQECLHSERARVREEGLALFFGISLRLDSAVLLEPYIDDLGRLLRSPYAALRKPAMFLLAQGLPAPSPRAVKYLRDHMHAASSDAEEVRGIAGTLLYRRPVDPATLHEVLALVHTRDDPSTTAGVVNNLGSFRITAEEALNFIKDGLKNPDSGVRREAVRAISMLDRDVRATFTEELQRVAGDSAEAPDIRKLAQGVLAQSGG